MRRQGGLKMQKPNLWQYSVYEALVLIAALIILFLLPELAKLVR